MVGLGVVEVALMLEAKILIEPVLPFSQQLLGQSHEMGEARGDQHFHLNHHLQEVEHGK